jgi:hypothetical protein
MDIGNVRNKNSVERSGERLPRAEKRPDEVLRSDGRDEARISDSGREAAGTVESLAERARAEPERQQTVQAALQRLMTGELDSVAVQRETARRMLESGYLAG